MQTHLLCGPAWSGKTTHMLERLRARLAQAPGSALWIGPTVRAVEALRERLLRESGALCCPRLHTFHEVLQEIIRVNDPAARPLTAVQRRLLTEDLVADLCDADRLAHFAGVADTRGFTDGVLSLLTELQRNAVLPDAFAAASDAVGTKERQCAYLYAQYIREIREQGLHDSEGFASRACGLLRRGLRQPFDGVRVVFVDGFGDFTRPQHDFLELLSAWIDELWIALPGDADDHRMELFARPRRTIERLQKLKPVMQWFMPRAEVARPAGLAHLERQLFRPTQTIERCGDSTGVEAIEAPGVLGETRLVARRIKKLLLNGAAPDEILVVLRDVSPYADVAREVFDEYGLPVEIEGTVPLTHNPAVAQLLRAVRLPDDDWPFAGVTALLRNTYFRPRWQENDGQQDLPQRAEVLLRLLGEPRGRAAYLTAVQRWAERQQPGLEDEEAEESRRRRIHELAKGCRPFLMRFFQAWDGAPNKAPLAEHMQWLRHFAQDIGVEHAAAEDEQDAAALEQFWREIGQWLDREEKRHGPGGKTLGHKTFLRRLTGLAAEACSSRSASGPGRVRVLSANQARHLDADYLFVLGLGERGFPRLTPPQSLFDEQELQTLEKAGLDIGAGDLMPEEMLLFYQVAVRARRLLVLSYPAVGARGQDLLPSSFLLAVRECFTEKAIPVDRQRMLIEGFYSEEPLSPAEYRVRAAAAWNDGGLADPALPADLRANLLDAADLNRLRFAEKQHNPYDGLFRNPGVIAHLSKQFGPERVFSPTALEDYVACPFRFFLRHVLRLEPLEEPSEEIEVTRRGQAYHRALARLHRKLKADGVHGPTEEVTERATREMAEAVEEDVRRAPSPAAKELWRLEGQRLVKEATAYVKQWRKFVEPWVKQGLAPQPHLFEADFGLRAPDGTTPVPYLTVRIDDVEVRVSGRIDRVDTTELDDGVGFWIIDYKTGASSHYTGPALAEYRRLQLTLYALAVEEVLLAGKAARPLGLAYWLAGEGGPKIALPGRATTQWFADRQHWQTVREDLRQWIATLVRHIRTGDFVLQPREAHCTQTCAFGQICRITQARAVGKEGMLSLPVYGGEGPA